MDSQVFEDFFLFILIKHKYVLLIWTKPKNFLFSRKAEMNPVTIFPANCNSKSLFRDFFHLNGWPLILGTSKYCLFFGVLMISWYYSKCRLCAGGYIFRVNVKNNQLSKPVIMYLIQTRICYVKTQKSTWIKSEIWVCLASTLCFLNLNFCCKRSHMPGYSSPSCRIFCPPFVPGVAAACDTWVDV